MDKDLQRALLELAGQNPQEIEVNQISPKDKVIIGNALDLLFSGLSLQKWLGNVTLAVAWSQAMDAMRDIVMAIPVENYVTRYVRWATFDYIKKLQIKMTSLAHTNKYIQCPPEKRDAWQEVADNKITSATNVLKHKIMDATSTFTTPVTPIVQVNVQEEIKFKDVPQYTLEHQHEHERERK